MYKSELHELIETLREHIVALDKSPVTLPVEADRVAECLERR